GTGKAGAATSVLGRMSQARFGVRHVCCSAKRLPVGPRAGSGLSGVAAVATLRPELGTQAFADVAVCAAALAGVPRCGGTLAGAGLPGRGGGGFLSRLRSA